MYKRFLSQVLKNTSFHTLILGPRQTGKTSLMQEYLGVNSEAWLSETSLGDQGLLYNLVRGDEMVRLAQNPSLLRKEVQSLLSQPSHRPPVVVIDEVQRVPSLLNELQGLIDGYKQKWRVFLSGSSARKLRRGHANLLPGRLVTEHLWPLTWEEILSADPHHPSLEDVLRYGTLPGILTNLRNAPQETILRSYGFSYLKEEIQAEAIVRNLGGFSRFLELAAHASGQILNISGLSRESGLPQKTVQNYFQILLDTLVAVVLPAASGSARKRLVSHPKFYFFDTGVTNALCERTGPVKRGTPLFGALFEQFLILEIMKFHSYQQSPAKLSYWRTAHGAEVDLIIEKGREIWAVEIKGSENIPNRDLVGLRHFHQSHPTKAVRLLVAAPVARGRSEGGIDILPWEKALHDIRGFLGGRVLHLRRPCKFS